MTVMMTRFGQITCKYFALSYNHIQIVTSVKVIIEIFSLKVHKILPEVED